VRKHCWDRTCSCAAAHAAPGVQDASEDATTALERNAQLVDVQREVRPYQHVTDSVLCSLPDVHADCADKSALRDLLFVQVADCQCCCSVGVQVTVFMQTMPRIVLIS
jgi:hypothetical protein